jgi:hypothetical protein
MKRIIVFQILLALSVCASFGQGTSKLMEVRKIYIGDLGREEGSDLVREKIRLRLMKTDRFTVVE